MSLKRSQRSLFILSTSIIALSQSYSAADFDLQLQDNKISLGNQVVGHPVLTVREWIPSNENAKQETKSEEVVVGSAVVTDALSEIILKPANDPWSKSSTNYKATNVGNIIQSQSTSFQDFTINAEWTEVSDNLIRVSGSVNRSENSSRSSDIPMTLYLSVPIQADDVSFLYNPTEQFEITDDTSYNWTFPTTAGPYGTMSRFPFGGVVTDHTGIAIYHRLDAPRILRVGWNGEQHALVAEVDVALSSIPEKMKDNVPFEFFISTFDQELGFRSMMRNYIDLFPDSFEDRTEVEGNWMPFTQIDKVTRPEDFAFTYHEYHPTVSVAYNTENDIESLVYCEPPVKYINIPSTLPQTDSTLQNALKAKTSLHSSVRSSGTRKLNGEMLYTWVVTPWAIGARVGTNSDLEVPRSSENPQNAFDYSWAPYIDLFRNYSNDQPVGWSSGGMITDGIPGTFDRALFLSENDISVTQVNVIKANPSLTIRARGTQGSVLEIRINNNLTTVTPSFDFDKIEISLPAMIGQQDFSFTALSGEIAIDEIKSNSIQFQNASFDLGQNDPEKVTGLYLDSFEGWDSKDLNFDPEQLKYSDYPLTFDSYTGQTAQVIMFHNFEFAAEARKRLEARDDLLMANTALYQWSWSAAWMDVMGIETNWGTGPSLVPPSREEMLFIRMLSYQRPYCYLQNLDFAQFRGEKVEGYFKYCMLYGFWPSFFSFNAADSPYWEDPKLYDEDREYFLRYMEPQRQLTSAGWEPITLAKTNHEDIYIERWGGGRYDHKPLSASTVYFTVFNDSNRDDLATISFDHDLLKKDQRYAFFDILTAERLFPSSDAQLVINLPEDGLRAIQAIEQTPETMNAMLKLQTEKLLSLCEKWNRFGMVSDTMLNDIEKRFSVDDYLVLSNESEKLKSELLQNLEPLYQEEATRAISLLQQYCSIIEETIQFGEVAPVIAGVASPGDVFEIDFGNAEQAENFEVVITGELTGSVPFENGIASRQIPQNIPSTSSFQIEILPKDRAASALRISKQVHLRPAVELYSLPDKLLLRTSGSSEIVLARNSPQVADGKLTVQSTNDQIRASLKQVESRDQNFETYEILYSVDELNRPSALSASLDLRFELNGKTLNTWPVDIEVVSDDSSLLLTELKSLKTDSTYFGYNSAPIVDGVTDTTKVSWAEAAWASEESMVAHWIEFEFKQPTDFSEVTIHWAHDSGTDQTSSLVRIEAIESGSSEWKNLAVHSNPNQAVSSKYEVEAQNITKLRLYQPPGKGPVGRPGIMWIEEVEVR